MAYLFYCLALLALRVANVGDCLTHELPRTPSRTYPKSLGGVYSVALRSAEKALFAILIAAKSTFGVLLIPLFGRFLYVGNLNLAVMPGSVELLAKWCVVYRSRYL